MKCRLGSRLGSLLLLAALQAFAVEHPGTLPKGSNCVSCHADKSRGQSGHAAMAMPCTVCHLLNTQDDLTTVNLATPKEQICFACHETSPEFQHNSPAVKGRDPVFHGGRRSPRKSRDWQPVEAK
jgi:hypothetical protein